MTYSDWPPIQPPISTYLPGTGHSHESAHSIDVGRSHSMYPAHTHMLHQAARGSPADRCLPAHKLVRAHMCITYITPVLPALQLSQRPHAMLNGTDTCVVPQVMQNSHTHHIRTRSPTLVNSTSAPHSITSPVISCPRTILHHISRSTVTTDPPSPTQAWPSCGRGPATLSVAVNSMHARRPCAGRIHRCLWPRASV